MKKIFLLFVSLAVLSCSSDDKGSSSDDKQLKITKLDGTEIVDGDVINVTSVGNTSLVAFYVKNVSSSSINVKAKLVSTLNADGSQMQFCFGQVCYSAVSVGSEYPLDRNEVISVPANGQVGGESFHFQNNATSTSVIDYVFEFYQFDENDAVVGNKVRVTYRYTPTAG